MTCLGKQHGVVVVVVRGVKGELQRVLSDNFLLSTSLGAFEEMLKRVARGWWVARETDTREVAI